ncbi:MAG: diaminopimelate decarboxylase [Proteobacteria bacterium]|nr:diaminopimelate decarboxylase [Pseudomonadota bacterium]MDA0927941.1 diaminopimelate decarboxylase [Pseudomonadota bacterium]
MQNDPAYFTWWQRPDLGYQQGELSFAGTAVRELIAEHGTPTFVYSKQRVANNIQRLQTALDGTALAGRYTILYAMKANRFAPLLQFLSKQGSVGIDACSPNEVAHAVACGFEPEEISFTAGSLSQQDVKRLSEFDGLFMDCDSQHAIKTWGQLKPGTEIGIRVNPGLGVSRAGNDRLQYAGDVTTKFGIYKEQFADALELAKQYQLTVSKIHFHTGCGFLTSELNQLDQVISACLWFVDNCPTVKRVNVGGGLGVPHFASDNPLDLEQWAAVLAKHFAGRDIHLEMEPGEYIVKDCGLLLLSKTYLEKKRNTLFLGVDAGFNIAPEPAYYNLPFQPVPLIDPQGDAAATLEKVMVVGNINEALDVWYEDALLPDMSEETHLVLINAGGYSTSMASNHCMRGEFKEVLLD